MPLCIFSLSSDEEEDEPDMKEEKEEREEEEEDDDNEEEEMERKLAELKAEEVAELKRYATGLLYAFCSWPDFEHRFKVVKRCHLPSSFWAGNMNCELWKCWHPNKSQCSEI